MLAAMRKACPGYIGNIHECIEFCFPDVIDIIIIAHGFMQRMVNFDQALKYLSEISRPKAQSTCSIYMPFWLF